MGANLEIIAPAFLDFIGPEVKSRDEKGGTFAL